MIIITSVAVIAMCAIAYFRSCLRHLLKQHQTANNSEDVTAVWKVLAEEQEAEIKRLKAEKEDLQLEYARLLESQFPAQEREAGTSAKKADDLMLVNMSELVQDREVYRKNEIDLRGMNEHVHDQLAASQEQEAKSARQRDACVEHAPQLVAMGFDLKMVLKTLVDTNGDEEQAINILLHKSPALAQ